MSVNGAMLRLARQRKGFHQTEAAIRLGIEQSLLSRIENNLAEARDELVVRAETVYGVPRSFFALSDPILGAPVSVHPMWRRKADVTVRELDTVVAELNIRVMHLRRLLEGVEIGHVNDVPRLDVDDYESAEKIASVVRAHWRVPRGPLLNLTGYVERAGILVAHSRLGGTSISGVTFCAPGAPPLIVLNSDQPSDRMRFTLAHELGHIVMHKFPSPNMEEEANEFASALLMPEADIRPYFAARRIDLAFLASLKPQWQVAMQALLYRATSLECISKNQAQYLWKQISARRLRLREPPELDFPKEKPSVLERVLTVHQEGLGYSVPELAKLLHIYESDLEEMYRLSPQLSERPKLTIIT